MRKTIVAIGVCFVLSGLVSFFAGQYVRLGDWKPVGDGRTIVNTRTGELVNLKFL